MPFQIIGDNIRSVPCDARVEILATPPYAADESNIPSGKRLWQNSSDSTRCAVVRAENEWCTYIIYSPTEFRGTISEKDRIRFSYKMALQAARDNGLNSVALPLIRGEDWGCPKDVVLRIISEVIEDYLRFNEEARIFLAVRNKHDFSPDSRLLVGLSDYILQVKEPEREGQQQNRWISEASTCSFPAITTDNIETVRRFESPAPASSLPKFSFRPATSNDSKPQHNAQSNDGISFAETASRKPSLFKFKRHSDIPLYSSSPYSSSPIIPPSSTIDGNGSLGTMFSLSMPAASIPVTPDIEKKIVLDESFSQMVLRKIDENGFRKDSDCYNRANIDRRLFSRIRSDNNYHPKKTTALALAIALELSLDETNELLMKAGYVLSHSILSDIIVEYCIIEHIYNIFEVNALLYKYDQALLGG